MEAEQTLNGETQRNDRLLAVAETSHLYSNLQTVDDLPEQARTEISEFFANYHKLQGKHSRSLGWKGPQYARNLIEQGIEQALKHPRP
jgi:inorganic pyrophosphatase